MKRPLSKKHSATGSEVVKRIRRYRQVCDVGLDCLNSDNKFTEFDPRLVGQRVEYRPAYGSSLAVWAGEWTLTGHSIFAYTGLGSVFEAHTTNRDGKMVVGWLHDFRVIGELRPPVEPFEEVPNTPTLIRRTEGAFVAGGYGDHPTTPSRVARTFFGVRLPRFTDWWDTRSDEKHRGLHLRDRDRIIAGQYFLKSIWDTASPHSCSHYSDTCEPDNAHHTARSVQDVRDACARMWMEWRRAHRQCTRPRVGGGVEYPPMWVEFGNYGWSIHATRESGVVRGFRGQD